MKTNFTTTATICVLAVCWTTTLSLSGCSYGEKSSVVSDADSAPAVSVDGSKYLLDEEPGDVRGVTETRKDAKDGDDLVIVGRIGGSQSPFTEGLAAFSIVDESLRACSDIPGDLCEKPWDYCCETHLLADSTVLVKVVDDQETLIQADARQLLQVKELSTVVVQGKAKRDDAGNLTVLAHHIYVKE